MICKVDFLTAFLRVTDYRVSDQGTMHVRLQELHDVPGSYKMRQLELRHIDRPNDPLRGSPTQIGPLEKNIIEIRFFSGIDSTYPESMR